MSIKLLVADDHEVVRSGMVSLVADDQEIEVVAEASDGKAAIKAAREYRPDVALLDIRMRDSDGFAALEVIRCELPEIKVVILSTYDNPTYIARAAALGACDYVLKGSNRQILLSTIHAAAIGEAPTETSELRKVAKAMLTRRVASDADTPLTNREMQVLRHLALGLSNKEIGKSLDISIDTVKEHVQNTLRKIGVSDRTQAAVWAVRQGLV